MKEALVVACMMIAVSNSSYAQGTGIHNRLGESGAHFTLSATQPFMYEATISGGTTAYGVQLEVFHNGILKHSDQALVHQPQPAFLFNSPVGLDTWGLRGGDTVTFILRVFDLSTGETLTTHCLHGEVGGT